MNRRSFISYLTPLLAAVGLSAQTAVIKAEKAVVCEGNTTKCPNGHTSCRNIDMPLAIGNDRSDYPATSQLFEYHVMFCTVCRVLFVEPR